MATPDKAASAQTRPVAVLKWTAIVIAGLLVVLLIALAVLDANADALRGPIARLASGHLGRTVHIDGPLQLQVRLVGDDALTGPVDRQEGEGGIAGERQQEDAEGEPDLAENAQPHADSR